MRLTFDQVHTYVQVRHPEESIQARDKVSVRCVLCGEKHASCTWFLNNSGGFKCHRCGGKGSLLQFEMQFSNCDIEAARKNIAEITGATLNSNSGGRFVTQHIYRDLEGLPVFKKDRYERPDGSKYFISYRYDAATGKWQKCLASDTPRFLYNQPELTSAHLILDAEGEGCCDALKEAIPHLFPERQKDGLRITTTTNYEGAWKPDTKPKWRPEYNKSYSNKWVVTFEDNDANGRARADHVSAQIYPFAASVHRVAFLDKPPKYDIADWIDEHRDNPEEMYRELERMIASAPLWEPSATNPEQDGFGLKLKRGTKIVEREQAWEVPDFLPGNTLTNIIGEIGQGKTRACMSICADISQGRTPIIDGERADTKRNVLFISNEDSEAWLRKMFVEMGGDLENLYVEDEDSELPWNLGDTASLEARIIQCQPAIVVIDSLSTYCPDGVNLWKHSDIAPYLVKLRKLATRHCCIIILVHHFNKTITDDPIQKAAGTKGIPGTARHNILIGPDKAGDDDDRIAVTFKTNLAKDRHKAYRFQLLPFQWNGPVVTTAREVLKEQDAEDTATKQAHRQQAQKEKAERDISQCAEAEAVLIKEILRRSSAKESPIFKRAAEAFLMGHGYTRAVACTVIDRPIFQKVRGSGPGKRPTELHLYISDDSAGIFTPSPNPNTGAGSDDAEYARPHEQRPGIFDPSETRVNSGDFQPSNMPENIYGDGVNNMPENVNGSGDKGAEGAELESGETPGRPEQPPTSPTSEALHPSPASPEPERPKPGNVSEASPAADPNEEVI